MSRAAKGWLIAATALTIAGAMLFVGILAAVGFDFHKLETVKYVTVTHELSGDFDSIDIEVTKADVELIPTEEKQCRVVCYEPLKTPHSASVNGKTLNIGMDDERGWLDYIGISFKSPEIKLYLPKKSYVSFTMRSVTGDVDIPKDFSFEKLKIKGVTGDVGISSDVSGDITIGLTTGKVRLNDIKAGGVDISTTTGDVTLSDVLAEGRLSVECVTGDVRFDGCDADSVSVNVVTGDITGTLRTGKDFDANTTTGKISVPDSVPGGKCKLNTTTGDIRISIEKAE